MLSIIFTDKSAEEIVLETAEIGAWEHRVQIFPNTVFVPIPKRK